MEGKCEDILERNTKDETKCSNISIPLSAWLNTNAETICNI